MTISAAVMTPPYCSADSAAHCPPQYASRHATALHHHHHDHQCYQRYYGGPASLPHTAYQRGGRRGNNTTAWRSPTEAQARNERKRQFALQFKTRACQTFTAHGACHYAGKCYFAHGPEDYRTMEQNEVDGLISDAAIRTWLRGRQQELAAAAAAVCVEAAECAESGVSDATLSLSLTPDDVSDHQLMTMMMTGDEGTPVSSGSFGSNPLLVDPSSSSSASSSGEVVPFRDGPARGVPYRFNPYSVFQVKVAVAQH